MKIWNPRVKKNLNIAFKVVKIKSLEMHISKQKLSLDIFTIGKVQNIFMEHDPYLSQVTFIYIVLLFPIK